MTATGSTSRGRRYWRSGARPACSTSGFRADRARFAARPGRGCRTACPGPPCCRSMRASRKPSRPRGRTRRWSSCGGRGTTSSSSPGATWPCSRSGRYPTTPRAYAGRRISPPGSTPSWPGRGCPTDRRDTRSACTQQPQVRGRDRHGPHPVGGRAATGHLDRTAARDQRTRGPSRARAPVPAHLRTHHIRGLRQVGGDQPAARRLGVRGARRLTDAGADTDRRRVDPHRG